MMDEYRTVCRIEVINGTWSTWPGRGTAWSSRDSGILWIRTLKFILCTGVPTTLDWLG